MTRTADILHVNGGWLARLVSTVGLFVIALLAGSPAFAQELLQNRSFETPVTPQNGNNFYTSIPDWTITPNPVVNSQPANVIRPFSGYANNPTATPAGGGVQYFDINATSGIITQSVTFPTAGHIDFSGWFSVRDFQQALTSTIVVRNSAGTIVASATATNLASDAIGVWRQAVRTTAPVSAGTHTFEIQLDNFGNCDLMSLVFKPAIAMTKTSAVVRDPVNLAVNPKFIPGAFVDYTLQVSNPAAVTGPPVVPGYALTSDSVIVSDPTPPRLDLFVGNLSGAGTGPAEFTVGTSGLGYIYTSLASQTDRIDFSNDNGANWTHVPTPDADGFAASVTNVRMRPTGAMAAGTTFSFRLRYRVK